MKLIRISQIAVGSLVAAALGCGGSEPPARTTTETTSGTMSSITQQQLNEAQENASRLERERDEARQMADAEKARRDREVQAIKERSDYEVKVRKELDATDAELRAMKEKSLKGGTAANRAHVDELMKKRDDIEQLLRRAQDESADGWDRFKSEVDMAVEDLKKSVSMPAQPQRTMTAPGTSTGGTMGTGTTMPKTGGGTTTPKTGGTTTPRTGGTTTPTPKSGTTTPGGTTTPRTGGTNPKPAPAPAPTSTDSTQP
jgi:hypothetical protein